MGKVLFMRKGETHTKPKQGLPVGYTKLTYIQSSGTQRIDTLFAPNQNTRIVVDFEILTANASGWRSVFGSRESASSGHFALFLAGTDSPNYVNQFYSDIGNTTHWFGSSVSVTGRHTVDCNKNVISIDGNAYSHTAVTFQSTRPLYLFANNEAGTFNMGCDEKIYSCQIYDNGTLVRDYVPCINASGEVGLYDLVGKKFYGNAGTGTFTGSEVA